MVELIVVLMIAGIMAAVAVPRFTGSMALKDVGYRDQVKASIEIGRKYAVARRRYTCVAIAASSVTLTAELVQPQNHAGNCPYTALNYPSKSTNVITAPSGVTIAPVPTTIMFDAQGVPNLGATTVFTVTDGSSGSTSTFTVEAQSGYVH